MGFYKFKHLPKSECCHCIKEHLLPHRSIAEIRHQISIISSSEQRQHSLKDQLKKQKKLCSNNALSKNDYRFIAEIHYKSPFEQSESIQLPSIYTVSFCCGFFFIVYFIN
jgi:hypothetical protein